MKYEIVIRASVVTGDLIHKVVLWQGKNCYEGRREYRTWAAAEKAAKAAKAAGAKSKD